MDQFFTDCRDCFGELHDDCKDLIEGLPHQALDWKPGEAMNSLTVLVVHLAGAERYWIGDVAMQEPSGRLRADEFRVNGLRAEELLDRLDASLVYMQEAFDRLSVEDLAAVRVSPRDGRQYTVGWAIQHALSHTALHAGHMQITRQLWERREK